MGKLTKTEIKAIAEEIRAEVVKKGREQTEEENKRIKEEFFTTESGQKVKAVLDDESIKDCIYLHELNRLIGYKHPYYPSPGEIERRIIIKQIECKDVESLIESVKEHFKLENN